MILTGEKIKQERLAGNISIEPFYNESIQPNSYDFHLGSDIIQYKNGIINDELNKNFPIKIDPVKGFKLNPGEFYLGITKEIIASNHYAQLLFGDNSIGSLGVWVQVSAPLAHVGSKIRWTLEIKALKETIIYPGMKFGKICFLVNQGHISCYGNNIFHDCGKYIDNRITPSLIKPTV